MDRRRQVLSYSDALAAPSGDVDLEAPLPSLRANGASSSASASRAPKPHKEIHSPYEMAWPQAPLYSAPQPPQPQRRVEPLTLAPPPAYGHQSASATYPAPPQPQHFNGPHSSPYPGPPFVPHYYSGPPPPIMAPFQQAPQFPMSSNLPYPPAPYTAPASASAIPTGPKSWVGRQSQPLSSGAPTPPYHYHDSGPASLPHRRYGTPTFPARRQKFPSQANRMVIEDCDASSDEEEDADEADEIPDHSMRKSIRKKTLEEVALLWRKTQGLPSALLPATGSGSSSPALHSADHTEYEKKQAQIKLMTEKIKQLEAAREKAKQAATTGPSEQQEVRQETALAQAGPGGGALPEATVKDQVVMAALPVEYGGNVSAAATSPAESDQTKDAVASMLETSATSPVPVPSDPIQQTEAGPSQRTSASPAPLVLQLPSEDLEEGEYLETTEALLASPSTPSTRKLVLDPQLAEQKRKLLEAMKKKVKSAPATPEEILPSPVSLKRKADGREESGTAPEVVPPTSMPAPAAAAAPAPAPKDETTAAQSHLSPTEEISSKRLKRQRKKARQRAAAAALLEASPVKKEWDEVKEAKQEVDKSELTLQTTTAGSVPSSSSNMSISPSSSASPPHATQGTLLKDTASPQAARSPPDGASKEMRKGKRRWCPVEAIEGSCNEEGCEYRHAL